MQLHNHLTPRDIEEIIRLRESGIPTSEIARRLGFTPRQVREALKNSGRKIIPEWTDEEIHILIYYYKLGFTTPAKLSPYLPNKADYAIRNKIHSLINKKILQP